MLNNTLSLVCRGCIKIQKLVCKGRFGTTAYTHPGFALSHHADHSLVSPASVPWGMHLGIAQFSWGHRANIRLSNHSMCFLSTVDSRTLCLYQKRCPRPQSAQDVPCWVHSPQVLEWFDYTYISSIKTLKRSLSGV